MRKCWAIFACFLLLQGGVWWASLSVKPAMEIVPNVPGEHAVKALSLGEGHAFFRLLGLTLQNFGDSYGRFSALKDYDFERLKRWMLLLDTLDMRSHYIPFLAGHYFSQTQKVEDIRFIVEYLAQNSADDIQDKWWWRTQAVYLAQHRLEDLDLALELAKPLVEARNVPLWVNQMPAFIHEKRGEFGDALAIMEHVSANAGKMTQGELNFIRYFVRERLQSLEENQPVEVQAGGDS